MCFRTFRDVIPSQPLEISTICIRTAQGQRYYWWTYYVFQHFTWCYSVSNKTQFVFSDFRSNVITLPKFINGNPSSVTVEHCVFFTVKKVDYIVCDHGSIANWVCLYMCYHRSEFVTIISEHAIYSETCHLYVDSSWTLSDEKWLLTNKADITFSASCKIYSNKLFIGILYRFLKVLISIQSRNLSDVF